MDHHKNTYVAITLSKNSRYFDHPSGITSIHPLLNYCGPVGELPDVHLVSMSKEDWLRDGHSVMLQLMGSDGVLHVEVQVLRTRRKRLFEEL